MQIFWVNITKIKYKNLIKKITKFDKQNMVFTPNPEMLLEAKEDDYFKFLLNKADFCIPDWTGIFIAFQIRDNFFYKIYLKTKKPYKVFLKAFIISLSLFFYFRFLFFRKSLFKKYGDKICWSDLTLDLLEYSNLNNVKISIIDLYNPFDEKKIESQKVFEWKLQKKFYELDFDYFIYKEEDKEDIIEKIKSSKSKILFSTLWMKKQEFSVSEIMDRCPNIKLGVWVWSSFDHIVWFQKRAPFIFKLLWLEWFYRLLTWPQKKKRLKRLWRAIFVFLWKV